MNTQQAAAAGKSALARAAKDDMTFVDRFRENPRPVVTKVIVIAFVALVASLGFRMWKSSADRKLTDVATELYRAALAPEPTERAAILNDLQSKTHGTPAEAHRLRELAAAYRDVANTAKSNAEKKAAWQNCLGAATTLLSNFPGSVWATMPTRPGSEESPPVAESLKSLAEQQLAWLEKNPFAGPPTAETGLKVTFELESGKRVTVGKFYSATSPYACQNFVNLCRDGYFNGTSIATIRKGYRKSTKTFEQSVVGLELGDPMTKVTPDDRSDDGADPSAANDLPYTLPDESTNLPIGRGSLVMRQNFAAGGFSPTRLAVYFDEVLYTAGTPFAEVTEGLEFLEELSKGDTEIEKAENLKTMTKIVNVTVEGSVANPPTGRQLPKYEASMLPEAPKPK